MTFFGRSAHARWARLFIAFGPVQKLMLKPTYHTARSADRVYSPRKTKPAIIPLHLVPVKGFKPYYIEGEQRRYQTFVGLVTQV